jgi:hypothetical protein
MDEIRTTCTAPPEPAPNPKFARSGLVGLECPDETSAITPCGDMKTYYADVVDGRRIVFLPWAAALAILWSPTAYRWQVINGDVIAEAHRLGLRPAS